MQFRADRLRLETERLTLREMATADWRAVHELMADAEVVRYVEYEPLTPQGAKALVRWARNQARIVPRTTRGLAIALRGCETPIGLCSLIIRDVRQRQADIGYVLGRLYWGHGYGAEAAAALLAHGFEQLGLHRIIAECDPANRASVRVLERIGMRPEGHQRECRWIKGAWRDRLLFAVLDHEWKGAGVGVPGGERDGDPDR